MTLFSGAHTAVCDVGLVGDGMFAFWIAALLLVVARMPSTIDHVHVAVPHALFPVRLARVRDEVGTFSVLASQLGTVVSPRDVEALAGAFASSEVRQQLVLLGDLNASAGRCKLGKPHQVPTLA